MSSTVAPLSQVICVACSDLMADVSVSSLPAKSSNLSGTVAPPLTRSEEHTSELQSHSDLHSFPTRRSSALAGDLRSLQRLDGGRICQFAAREELELERHRGATLDGVVDAVHIDRLVEALGGPGEDGVGARLRGRPASLVGGRSGHRVGAHSGAVARDDAVLEAGDVIGGRAGRLSRDAAEVRRATGGGTAVERRRRRIAQVDLERCAVDAGTFVARDVGDRARGYLHGATLSGAAALSEVIRIGLASEACPSVAIGIVVLSLEGVGHRAGVPAVGTSRIGRSPEVGDDWLAGVDDRVANLVAVGESASVLV